MILPPGMTPTLQFEGTRMDDIRARIYKCKVRLGSIEIALRPVTEGRAERDLRSYREVCVSGLVRGFTQNGDTGVRVVLPNPSRCDQHLSRQ